MHELGHALGPGHATNLLESTDLMGYGWPDLGDPVLSDCDLDALAFVFDWALEGGDPYPPAPGSLRLLARLRPQRPAPAGSAAVRPPGSGEGAGPARPTGRGVDQQNLRGDRQGTHGLLKQRTFPQGRAGLGGAAHRRAR
jgi:hypothetical protein